MLWQKQPERNRFAAYIDLAMYSAALVGVIKQDALRMSAAVPGRWRFNGLGSER